MRSLDEGENFRLTVKEEMFLARHLKEDRPGLLQAGVKDRSTPGIDNRSERTEPVWGGTKEVQKWNCRLVRNVESNAGRRDF